MGFLAFLQSTKGRILRIGVGATLVWIGATLSTLTGVLLMVVGLIPVVTGMSNVSLFEELIADVVLRRREFLQLARTISRGNPPSVVNPTESAESHPAHPLTR